MGRKKKETMDQLSRDALMARRLGMSYGKYKAMHYERERKQRERQEQLVAEAKRHRKERIVAEAKKWEEEEEKREKSNRLGK